MTDDPPSAAETRYQRVLFATDGSPVARVAADHAIAVAERFEAELLVVYVVSVDAHSGIHLQDELLEERRLGEAYCAEIATAAEARVVAVRRLLVRGQPGPTLVDVSASESADLIVLGRRGQSLLERLLIGSVASYVSEHSTVPVLLVPG